MTDNRVRGFINHEEFLRQPLVFDDMDFIRNTSLTDIDTFYELNGKLFIYGEIKYGELPLTSGQRIALTNVCKSHLKAGNIAVAYHANHNILPPNLVSIKDLLVIEYFWQDVWIKVQEKVTVKDFHTRMIEYCKNKNIEI